MDHNARGLLAMAVVSGLIIGGCDQQQIDDLCEAKVRLAALEVQSSYSPNYGYQPDSAELADELGHLLANCKISTDGVSITTGYVLTLPELYMLANDFAGVERTLSSSVTTLGNSEATQLLTSAARYGDIFILRSVVREGIDPTLRDEVGNNALMAVPGGREPKIEKIQFLMENGVPLDYRTDGDFSILDVAIATEDQTTLSWILEQLDRGNDAHVSLVRRSLEIALKVESPMSSDVGDWLSKE